MGPGYLYESLPATKAGTDIHNCVLEAVATLRAPEELRCWQENFTYDPICREWGFDGYYFKGPKVQVDPRTWVEKICDWLQVNYPDGPLWGIEEPCL